MTNEPHNRNPITTDQQDQTDGAQPQLSELEATIDTATVDAAATFAGQSKPQNKQP